VNKKFFNKNWLGILILILSLALTTASVYANGEPPPDTAGAWIIYPDATPDHWVGNDRVGTGSDPFTSIHEALGYSGAYLCPGPLNSDICYWQYFNPPPEGSIIELRGPGVWTITGDGAQGGVGREKVKSLVMQSPGITIRGQDVGSVQQEIHSPSCATTSIFYLEDRDLRLENLHISGTYPTCGSQYALAVGRYTMIGPDRNATGLTVTGNTFTDLRGMFDTSSDPDHPDWSETVSLIDATITDNVVLNTYYNMFKQYGVGFSGESKIIGNSFTNIGLGKSYPMMDLKENSGTLCIKNNNWNGWRSGVYAIDGSGGMTAPVNLPPGNTFADQTGGSGAGYEMYPLSSGHAVGFASSGDIVTDDCGSRPPPTTTYADDDYTGLPDGTMVGFPDGDPTEDKEIGYDAFASIQDAIDAVSNSTVYVASGTYVTQLYINKDLDLIGAGRSTTHIVAPTSGSRSTYTIPESGRTFDPVVIAFGGTESGGAITGTGTIDFSMTGFHVDGNDDATASTYAGIFLRNVNPGEVLDSAVDGLAPSSGNPETGGIMVYGDSDATIQGNLVSSHTRIGISANGDNGALPDPSAEITLNEVTGLGPTGPGSWAQNGIQIGFGATGSIDDNLVSDHSWAGDTGPWAASSILVYDAAGSVQVTDNEVVDGQVGVYWITTNGLIGGNNIHVTAPFAVCDLCNGEISGIIVDPGEGPELIPASPFEAGEVVPMGFAQDMEQVSATYTVVASDNTLTGVPSSGSADTVGLWVMAFYGDTLDFSGSGNDISLWDTGVAFYHDTSSSLNVHDFKCNNLYSNNNYGAYNLTTTLIDVEQNWWGNASGPTHAGNPAGSGDAVTDYLDYEPWLGAAGPGGCYGSLTASWQNLRTGELNDLQSLLDSALTGDTIQFVGDTSVTYPLSVTPTVPGVTVDLNGGTFSGGSPWMTVNVADITVLGPGTLNGGGSTSDPAILVVSGGDNFRLEGVEVTGWQDGVHVQDPVVSLKIISNWIHSNTDNALQVDGTPSGVVTIEGNLFKVNGGTGVTYSGSGSLDATYNSWGHIDGANPSGDGAGAGVTWEPFTYVEYFLDMQPDTSATQVTVSESQSFNVKLKADAVNLFGMTFELTYDTSMLTLNSAPVFSAPWSGTCTQLIGSDPFSGTVSYFCSQTSGTGWTPSPQPGDILTMNFTAQDNGGLTGNGPWDAYFDIEHLEVQTSAGAVGGVKIFVNNAGFNAPSVPDRDITDTDDGVVHINGIAQFTGFIDLQGRGDDSGALFEVFGSAAVGSTRKANDTSASSGKYVTTYDSGQLLVINNPYWFYADRALYLPTQVVSGTTYVPWHLLDTRPMTSLSTLMLLGGDATDDDVVDALDAGCIGGSYGSTSPPPCSSGGSTDVNGDGVVNILDLVLMGGNYGLSDSGVWNP
jgi:hypothetical protein